MINRRRLLTLTAAGISVAALGGLGTRRAYAADRRDPLGIAARHGRGARRLSLLGRQEVRLFRRHRDDARARAVGRHRHGEARRPGPGRHGLPVAGRVLAGAGAGHSAGLGLRDGRRRRVRLRLPQGRGAGRHQGPRGQDHRARLAPAGSRSPIRCSRRRASTSARSSTSTRAGRPGAPRSCPGQGDAALSWEGLRAQWKGQGLDFDYILGRNFSKLPANSFVIRKADFEDPSKARPLRRTISRAGRPASSSAGSTRAPRRRSSWSSSPAFPRR